MNRLDRLVMNIGNMKSSIDSVFLRNVGMDLGDNAVLSNPYKKSDLVYIVISTTARAISQVPLVVYEVTNGERGDPVGKDNEWQKLYDRANIYTDRYSFTEGMVSYMWLDGNVWLVPFPPGMSFTGVPDSLWTVSNRFMQPNRNKHGHLESWRYSPAQDFQNSVKFFDLAPEEVVHIWFWNPDDPIMGQSPLVAGKIPITTDYQASLYNQTFFKHGAKPSGVVSTDNKIAGPQFDRLKAQMNDEHAGYLKTNKLMILEQGLKYTQTALSQKDMEFFDLRRFNGHRIMQILGMKAGIISEQIGGDGLNSQRAKEERKSWWQDTNIPIMNMIASALNFTMMQNTGLEVAYDLSGVEALQEDFTEKVENADKLSKIGFTANEINTRLKMGFDEKTWRDRWWKPMALVPIDESNPEGDLPEEPESDEPDVPAEPDTESIIELTAPGIEHKAAEEEGTERYQLLANNWKILVTGVRPIEKSFESKVKRVFFSMRKQALRDLFEGEEKSPSDLESQLFVGDKKDLQKTTQPLYREAMIGGIDSIAGEIGIDIAFDLNDPIAIEFLANKSNKIVGVVDTIKRQVSTTLSAGAAKGESIDQLAKRVKSVFNAADKRAKTIARTEVIGSTNFARNESIRASGFIEKEWFTALDEKVRDTHAAAHGDVVRVNEPWIVGGASLMFPGDPNGPPEEIINCRCVPVVVPPDDNQ